jgi:tetratricopeptide (TPR) repeat protein
MARGPGRNRATLWLAASALAGFGAAAVEPGAATDWTASTEPLLSSIEAEEARNGPFSPNLVSLLTSLGLTYQENDEHALAVTVLERALYLKRVNDGLYGLDQAALVQRLIDSERAIGRATTAGELEDRLLELARRNPGDLRGVPIFRAAAERQLALYERASRGELPPTFSFGGSTIGAVSSSPSARLRQAQMNYMMAIGTIMRSGELDHPELAALEDGLARAYYTQAKTLTDWSTKSLQLSADFVDGGPTPSKQRQSLHDLGRETFRRRLNRNSEDGAPLARARALVELGDWSLLFSHNATAMRRYAEADALLRERRVPAASIRELFPEDTPVFLPTFAPYPLDVDAGAAETGHVDVDFEIGKYGTPRKVRIVGASNAGAEARSKHVVAAISRARFRPLPAVATDAAYRLRYSLADGSLTPRL